MSSFSPKSQFYRYSLKTGGVIGSSMCTNIAWLYLLPPEDAQSIENLYCRIKLTFDSSVAISSRKLVAVGVSSKAQNNFNGAPAYSREVELNLQADGSRVVEATIDLTTILRKTDIRFSSSFGDFTTDDFTMVYIRLPDALQSILVVGTINVWKLDGTFTTKEIR